MTRGELQIEIDSLVKQQMVKLQELGTVEGALQAMRYVLDRTIDQFPPNMTIPDQCASTGVDAETQHNPAVEKFHDGGPTKPKYKLRTLKPAPQEPSND